MATVKTFSIKYRTTRNTIKETWCCNPYNDGKYISWFKYINKYPYQKKTQIPVSMVLDLKLKSVGTVS